MHVLDQLRYCPKCGSDHFLEDSEKSKRCGRCGFEWFLNPSSAVAAFIRNASGELLVARRRCAPAAGTLDLPGGFCDIGESLEEAVGREVREETGLLVTTSRYLFSLPNQYVYSGFSIPTLDSFFLCEVADDGHAMAMDDAADLLWLSPDQVRTADFGLRSIRTGVEMFLKKI